MGLQKNGRSSLLPMSRDSSTIDPTYRQHPLFLVSFLKENLLLNFFQLHSKLDPDTISCASGNAGHFRRVFDSQTYKKQSVILYVVRSNPAVHAVSHPFDSCLGFAFFFWHNLPVVIA